MSLHQRQQQQQHLIDPSPLSPQSTADAQHKRATPLFSRTGLLILLSLILVLGVVFPWIRSTDSLFSSSPKGSLAKWRSYTLSQAAAFVGKNGTVVVCAVSEPYIPFLNNWLISVSRQKHQDKVLVIAEDYATLYKVNERWPGHAVLVPPAPDTQSAHKFGSQVILLL